MNRQSLRITVLLITLFLCMGIFSSCAQQPKEETTVSLSEERTEVQTRLDNEDSDTDAVCLSALAGDIAQVVPMDSGAVAVLYTDGTVGVAGNDQLAETASSWRSIVQLYRSMEGGHLIARRKDGTVVSTHYDLSEWQNIKELYCCWQGVAGMTEDGRIVTAGTWEYGNPDGWTEIRDFWIHIDDCFGLKNDGSVVTTSTDFYADMRSWKNVRQLYFVAGDVFARLEDGSIVGNNTESQELKNLQGAVEFIEAGWPFALSADGRLLALTTKDGWVYNNGDYFTYGECEYIEDYPNIYIHDIRFKNIKDICECHALIMLKYDGTVDTVNIDYFWDLREWEDIDAIIPIYADNYGWGDIFRIYGIRKDGSVTVAECEYSEASITMKNYLGWNVLQLFKGRNEYDWLEGVVGITPDGTLVGDGHYANTDFSVLVR